MIALTTGIEAALIIDFIEAAQIIGTSVVSLLRLNSAGNSDSYNYLMEQESELQNGQFSKQILYNGQPINDCQFSQILNERILQIDRVCQSLWQYFPSGIFTIFSWALMGSAMRHEFIIVNTENHLCLIEMIVEKIIQNDKEFKINKLKFDVYYCQNDEARQNQRKLLLKNRLTDSVLASTKFNQNQNLYLFQINIFTNLLLLSWKKSQGDKLSLLDKISKQYARAVYYFSQPNPDLDIVLQSIFGIFTDKPLMLPRLDMILVEKAMYHGIQLSDEKKNQIQSFIELIKTIRESDRNPSFISAC